MRKYLLSILMLCTTFTLGAKIKLPAYYGDHMVLQQQAATTISGLANANKIVTLLTSWDNKKYSVKSDKQGRFQITITTPSAGGPYTMDFSDGELLRLSDILIGELWFCSGQSNMEMPVKGYTGQPVFGAHPYIVKAKESRPIRLFSVKNEWSKELKNDVSGEWMLHSSKNVGNFSAAAYFFGNLLEEQLDVPIGLINCSWSASKIESWMDRETLSEIEGIDLSVLKEKDFGYPNGTPTLLYNSMIHPFRGLAVKGILWYQGEANSPNPELYRKMFPAFAKQLRTFFKNEELPIYYVQIAPWQSGNKDEFDWADFRQVQLNMLTEVPNTGMVITSDLGAEKFIHPPHKIQVGERLAYWALAKTYHKEGFVHSGPIYKGLEKEGSAIKVSFEYGNEGLNPEQENVEGFELVDEKGNIVPAKAEIIGATNIVKVWNDEVKNPVEVRYCYRNYKLGTLKNNAGLPAAPFRAIIK